MGSGRGAWGGIACAVAKTRMQPKKAPASRAPITSPTEAGCLRPYAHLAQRHRTCGPRFLRRMALEAGSRGAERFDKIGADPPTRLPGRRVSNGFGRDGVHLLLGGYAWVRPCRLSTKPVVRIYAEADAPRGARPHPSPGVGTSARGRGVTRPFALTLPGSFRMLRRKFESTPTVGTAGRQR